MSFCGTGLLKASLAFVEENDAHKVLTENVFTRVAEVITVEEWIRR